MSEPGRCPAAGNYRNQDMVDLHRYWRCEAFIHAGSRGAPDCLRRARRAGIEWRMWDGG